MLTFGQLLRRSATQLAAVTPTPRLEAEILLAHAGSLSRSALIAQAKDTPAAAVVQRFETLIESRLAGEPVAYLTGAREFWSLELEVCPDTLIPRPETELLVEQALARIPAQAAWRIADLGTGSGAIAIAIAKERAHCHITATDASAGTLAVARRNARRLAAGQVEFCQGNWFAPLAGRRFEMVVSNPPYVCEDDPHLRQGDVRFEPRTALAAGADGLDAIRTIVGAAPVHLTPGGWLLLEHGYDQGVQVMELMTQAGFTDVHVHRDLEGRERVCEGQVTRVE